MVIAVLGLPGFAALGVADDDRLGEAGIEVKRQVRGGAAEVDGEAVGEQEGGQPHGQDGAGEELRSNVWFWPRFLDQRRRC